MYECMYMWRRTQYAEQEAKEVHLSVNGVDQSMDLEAQSYNPDLTS